MAKRRGLRGRPRQLGSVLGDLRAQPRPDAPSRERPIRAAAARLDPPGDYALEEDPIERDRIARAVATLTDGQAAVVRRAYFGGLTLNEVASELAIPIGTVKGRLSSALRALRRELIPEVNDAV